MHPLLRNITLTTVVATATIVGLCLLVVFAVFGITGAPVPVQSVVLTFVLPVAVIPGALYPLLLLYRRQRELSAELARQARTDALTDLPNRRAFFDFARALLEKPSADGRPLAVLIIDVDYFKRVNDTCGHDQGDETLTEIAYIIRDEVHASDAPRRIAARLGGEEFAVAVDELPPSAVGRLAESICRSVRLSVTIGAGREPVTVSVGVAFREPGMTIDQLLKRADDALYAAKRDGRDRWTFAAEEGASILRSQERVAS